MGDGKMKRAYKNIIIILATLTLASLLVSSATAVPHVQTTPIKERIQQLEQKKLMFEEKIAALREKLTTFTSSPAFTRIQTLLEQQLGENDVETYTDTPLLQKAKTTLENLQLTNANDNDILNLLIILLLTIYTEFFVYFIFTAARHGLTHSLPMLFFVSLGVSVLINVLTNPATNFVYNNIYDNIFVIEAVVVLVESFMIFLLFNLLSLPTTYSGALLLSFFANMMSFLLASSPDIANS
jgi:hypothetical protein